MTVFIPGRLVRLACFTLAAGGAGFHSAETAATTLCVLMILAACCRSPARLELVFASIAAFAARFSGGHLQGFRVGLFAVLPIALGLIGLYAIGRIVFGTSDRRPDGWRQNRAWRR